ncbi:type VII secretion protein EccCa [Actinomyces qiguomingii]|uniref:type VII secretion protein EccCa n=1 Tax=Actinomyces qiguomingii TaxID=2057800 RepID=UPI000CA02C6E|nr:type VII secretion protein EccCa [Actinomyces qiguomingii]
MNANSQAPELSDGIIEVKAPPDAVTPQDATSVLASVLPLTGSMGVMVFMAISNSSNTRMLLMGGGMVVAMLSMVAANIYRQIRQHRSNVTDQRREYLAYLSELRQRVRASADQQRRQAVDQFPAPGALPYFVQHGQRVWERGDGLGDPLMTRVGLGTVELAAELKAEKLDALAKPDPVCLSAMTRFVATHGEVDGLPMAISIAPLSRLEVVGESAMARAHTRALLTHLLVMTPPSRLKVAVLAGEENLSEWEWLKWAPHAWSDSVGDAVGPARLIATDLDQLIDKLPEGIEHRGPVSSGAGQAPTPQVIIVVDGGRLPDTSPLGATAGVSGVTVVDLPTQWGRLTSTTTLRLMLYPPRRRGSGEGEEVPMEMVVVGQDPTPMVADTLDVAAAEAVTRRLAARFTEVGEDSVAVPVGISDAKRSADLLDLLGLGDVRDVEPERSWTPRLGDDRLRVPFGVTPEGTPVILDIKESAQGGMGPHGLLVGATGSGKSEVLRTLVLALALTHSPDQLNFVLVDFKGGATFAGMSELPHVSAMISNLENELGLVDRMEEALRGEMNRRQEILLRTGNYANVSDYEAARRAGKHNGDPLPALFVILDEFSELLAAKPDFIEIFVAIGRLGRSMQIHLLLSSQRLEEGRLHGLESHLSYRIGLRTFSASESRTVLGVTDAYDLPPYPGVGYLKSDTRTMTRFRASYVAGVPPARSIAPARQAPVQEAAASARTAASVVLPFTAAEIPLPPQPEVEPETAPQEPEEQAPEITARDAAYADMSTMDIAVERMTGHGNPAHRIWLPPLDVPETFDSLIDDLVVDPELGLISPTWRARGDLVVPLGITDVPMEQRRDQYSVDLSAAGGHVGVVGGPLSGKSTALRSLLMGLALTHTPTEVQFYVIDLGGGTFSTMMDLPHMAGVGTRDDPDIIARIIAEIEAMLADRERYFKAHRIDSIQTYRRSRAAGQADDGYGDVFLVIDGWSVLKTDFDSIAERVQAMMTRALAFGVHLVISSGRWMEMRAAIKDALGTRIELRLGEPTDSEINRAAAKSVPAGRPGRGLDPAGRHMLLALPRLDGEHDPATLSEGVGNACRRIAESYKGVPGPKLRLLPTRIDLTELQAQVPAADGPVIGINESRLEPVSLNMRHEPHLIVLGDAKKGKSSFLRALMAELTRGRTPDDLRILPIDPRRSLLGDIPQEFMLTYVTLRDQAAKEATDLVEFLKQRLPGPEVTPEQLRTRSWWHGPEVYILVDDYDLLTTGQMNPLLPLQPLLPQGLDVGLHLVLTRRTGGASRALFEPLMQTLIDLSTPGIMLPGNPDEGPLLGRERPKPGPAGRASLITRDATESIQLAWLPPTA